MSVSPIANRIACRSTLGKLCSFALSWGWVSGCDRAGIDAEPEFAASAAFIPPIPAIVTVPAVAAVVLMKSRRETPLSFLSFLSFDMLFPQRNLFASIATSQVELRFQPLHDERLQIVIQFEKLITDRTAFVF